MPRKQQERVIGGTRYRVTQLGALTGGEFAFRMGMPLLTLVSASLGKRGLSLDSIRVLASSLKPDDFNWALAKFRESSEILIVDQHSAPHARTGEKFSSWQRLEIVYDDHFAGDYGNWLEWLKFCAEVNFGNFFGDLGAGPTPPTADQASSSSSSPTDATGGTSGSSPTIGAESATS